ncbi:MULTISPECIES: GNAT family N-acetyltransferase [unclassified Streptomyces]|uniref:GNAT family N-acetyltransferase n=1 Tax=unclassified Streptomyces TaxID=2593676 RepID=UPI001BE712CD|nr:MULTISPECIES: GNAT family N-acetyltransferase [unclassified Streptomyces]MBT2406722.1 GNAT family N-acetyltransferase [Streptomyces sp. ISL-21]MBT2453753.1 GNAT family N-acetyltransferase [Streptomyces sp. ISL-86]MBT2609002.1 GNAT family N-acetyltransferase [Streptomyces sp. ISL-87]
MDIVIRTAVPDDYAELGDITAQAYLDDGLLENNEDDAYERALRDVAGRAADAEVLVATLDGVLLGGVTFAPPGSRMADIAGPGEAEFRMLTVARAGRGRGAGEALVRACVERAQAIEGVTRLVLSTQAGSPAAHRIYERLGFVRTPERDWSPIPTVPLLTYALELRVPNR